MQNALRPWITAGVALTGAGLIAATPVVPVTPITDGQQRLVQLVGDTSYPMVGWDELVTTTTANWHALLPEFSTNPLTNAAGIADGWHAVFTDLADGTSNPVTNPTALLTEAAVLLISPGYASNAAMAALTGAWDNIQAAFHSHDYTTGWTDLANTPATVLNAFLNGGPSGGFGLLTGAGDNNPLTSGTLDAFAMLRQTFADELLWAGGVHHETALTLGQGNLHLSVQLGQILNQLGITIPSDIHFTIPKVALGGQTVDVSLDKLNLPDSISYTIPKDVVGGQTVQIPLNLPDHISYTVPTETVGGNTVDIPTGFPAEISYTLPRECVFHHCIGGDTVSIPTNFPDHISYTLPEHTFGGNTVDIPLPALPHEISYTIPTTAVGGQTIDIPINLPHDISYTIPTFDFGGNTVDIPTGIQLPDSLAIPIHLGDLLNGGTQVPDYVYDLSKDLVGLVGAFAPASGWLHDVVTGADVVPLLNDLLTPLGLPLELQGDVSVNFTDVVADLLNSFMH